MASGKSAWFISALIKPALKVSPAPMVSTMFVGMFADT